MKEPRDQFNLSPSELERVIDSLDETCGYLIKGNELKYWIEYYVNKHRNVHTEANNVISPH